MRKPLTLEKQLEKANKEIRRLQREILGMKLRERDRLAYFIQAFKGLSEEESEKEAERLQKEEEEWLKNLRQRI